MAEVARSKVAMIGLDAAELDFIRRHLHALPRLRRVLELGALHRLASTAGALTGSVWPTFATGTLPGEHGIYHHLQWDAEAMRIRRVTAEWLDFEAFWCDLERRGLRVAAVDVPMTFPSRLERGLEIINWGSHDELGPFSTAPRALAREVHQRFGPHPMGPEIPVRKTPGQLERIRRNLVAGARVKSELLRWVLGRADWDFFLGVFGETHRGGHLLWPASEDAASHQPLLDVYRAVDAGVGEVLDALSTDITTIVVFALHGMGPNTSQEHFMPGLMDRLNATFLTEGSVPGRGQPSPQRRGLVRLLRERVPAGLQNAIARAVPVAVRDEVVNRQISSGHDWSRTPGIALLADLNGYVRCNIRGREREGMLEPGSPRADAYLAWITGHLGELRTGDGEPLVREVLLARERFPGKRTGSLPDVIVTWTGMAPVSWVRSGELGEVPADLATGRAGNHRPDGWCVVIEREREGDARGPAPGHIADLARLASSRLQPS